ncbi:MAG: hypothetical protein ACOC1X_00920 [Promethearchaeota archaeon]
MFLELILSAFGGAIVTALIFMLKSAYFAGSSFGQVDINEKDIAKLQEETVKKVVHETIMKGLGTDMQKTHDRLQELDDDIKENTKAIVELQTKLDMVIERNGLDDDN